MSDINLEELKKLYEKLKKQNDEPRCEALVITNLVKSDGFYKYVLKNGNFAILMTREYWNGLKSMTLFIEDDKNILLDISGIPVFDDDVIASNIIYAGCVHIEFPMVNPIFELKNNIEFPHYKDVGAFKFINIYKERKDDDTITTSS